MDNILFEKKKKTSDVKIDYALILPAFLLILIGFIALWLSLSTDHPHSAKILMAQQGAWLLVGLAGAFFVMHFDRRTLWNLAPYLYGLGLILMIIPVFVYNPDMVAATGAKRWISIGHTNLFQPSELMKLAYILFMSRLIVNYRDKYKASNLRTDFVLILQMIIATAPVAFILVDRRMQNDFGTLMVFMAIFAGLLLLSGVSWKILLPLIVIVLAFVALLLFVVFSPDSHEILSKMGLRPYQIARFEAWINPFANAHQGSYQQAQSLISTAMGGLFGMGKGVMNISVPVRESDSIFTVISGGGGFVGASLVIFLYFYLIYRMIKTTVQANNQFYTFIGGGVTMMLLFHVFENIGASIGLLPLTGIPLPFISQGGSSLISNVLWIGLILSIRYNEATPATRGKTKDKYRRRLAKRLEQSARKKEN